MKVLITGAKGQLGQDFQKKFNQLKIAYIPTDYQELDITNIDQIRTLTQKEKGHNPYNKLCSIQQRRQSRRRMGKGVHNKRPWSKKSCNSIKRNKRRTNTLLNRLCIFRNKKRIHHIR